MYNIHFKVEGQRVLCDNPLEVASNLINKVTCSFEFLDNSWDGYDIIKAVFTNKKAEISQSLLIYKNGQHIPNEVLAYKGRVTMNLVACKYDEETEELVELQMTSYKCDAINVTYQVILEEDEPFTPTPSAFDQYVAIVKGYRDEAEGFKNRTEELASDVEHIIEGVAEEVEQKIQPKLDVKADRSEVERVESKVDSKADRSEITRLENEIIDKASISQLAEVTREVASVKETKQNKLVAGANITIEGDVISAEGGLAEVEWADVKNKPTEFKPSAHKHSTSDVDGLNADLNDLDNRLEDQAELLATKVDKEQGKGLSTNDYTDAEKTKLRNLENYDDTVIVDAINTLDEDLQTEKQAIESLESALPSKLTEPSAMAVGQFFKIASFDENGHAVLECVDAPSGGVSDVKVNNASVVADGVANIPIAGNNVFGVITQSATDRYNGKPYVDSSGKIILPELNVNSPQAMNARPFYNMQFGGAVTGGNVDYVVKRVLCDPIGTKPDTSNPKNIAWTEDEQRNAQIRIGIVTLTQEEYDLIDSPSDSVIYIIKG